MAPQQSARRERKEPESSGPPSGNDEQFSGTERTKGGRPSKLAVEELNRRILDTAAGLFASQGFAATSMEQVAAACGAGKDTIYRRYPSKTALFKALMDGLQSEVLGELDEIMSVGGTSSQRLRRFARALLTINLRPQMIALNRVALAEAVTFGGMQATPPPEDPIMIRFTALVKQAQADGAVAKGNPFFLAEQLLYATSIKPLISTMLGENRFSDLAGQERYFDHALDLFLQGAAPRV